MSCYAWLASIPSPSDNAIEIGPLDLRAYGVLIALGVVVATWIATRRWEARGGHTEAIVDVATWAVPAGIIGARAYHVATDWHRFYGEWWDVVAIWEGGLGIWGAVAGGTLGAYLACRRRGYDFAAVLDVVAPALPVAQAVGRFGNWFNQELFGRPTELPWGLEIDPAQRPAGYETAETFHPTFLYEALWNLGVAGALLLVERRFRLRTGSLFGLYVVGYTAGRLWIELMRIDPATRLLGLRINVFTSVAVLAVALGWVLWRELRTRRAGAESGGGRNQEPLADVLHE